MTPVLADSLLLVNSNFSDEINLRSFCIKMSVKILPLLHAFGMCARLRHLARYYSIIKSFKDLRAVMKKNKKIASSDRQKIPADYFERLWERSWTYIKTVVDVVREPMLILDKDLRVMAANESFYQTFGVESKETEGKLVHELGNGQWDIPVLQTLLADVMQKHTFFKGFQVAHDFPSIGRKVILLNARQIHVTDDDDISGVFPPIILLAMEDVTDMMVVAKSLASHANDIEAKLTARAQKLEIHIGKLETALNKFKKNPR